MTPRTDAVKLLRHHLRTAFERAGANWDADNDAEVEGLVDLIVDAAVHEVCVRLERARRP